MSLGALFQTNEVIPGLYLGSHFSAKNRRILSEYGITHILQVTHFEKAQYPEDYQYKVITLIDNASSNLMVHFSETHQFIDAGIASGGKVLVHCMAGVSRSATLVIAYLMWKRQLTVAESWDIVAKARSIIRPNIGFIYQLQLYEKLGYQVDESSEQYRDLMTRLQTMRDTNVQERRRAEQQVGKVAGESMVTGDAAEAEKDEQETDDDIVFMYGA
ncbi:protein-tyrosine phosphatase-like protein [Thamnocephalis sphaerospora]|uniref:Protein-tyrosine phosphatase-like protein n=1 Tax=Thamnocephalis sphaerospora TaxID=78915 RepID=A0A4P9XXA6_9FUNG|nr:protein-tyrosine phosphatase-like protein [Thamnocephalis sphaerospora]|eukprot:RKP10944.1 protein-tyrosine phosphatase-like protein [Thamnocephalis sphaerospora]